MMIDGLESQLEDLADYRAKLEILITKKTADLKNVKAKDKDTKLILENELKGHKKDAKDTEEFIKIAKKLLKELE